MYTAKILICECLHHATDAHFRRPNSGDAHVGMRWIMRRDELYVAHQACTKPASNCRGRGGGERGHSPHHNNYSAISTRIHSSQFTLNGAFIIVRLLASIQVHRIQCNRAGGQRGNHARTHITALHFTRHCPLLVTRQLLHLQLT